MYFMELNAVLFNKHWKMGERTGNQKDMFEEVDEEHFVKKKSLQETYISEI